MFSRILLIHWIYTHRNTHSASCWACCTGLCACTCGTGAGIGAIRLFHWRGIPVLQHDINGIIMNLSNIINWHANICYVSICYVKIRIDRQVFQRKKYVNEKKSDLLNQLSFGSLRSSHFRTLSSYPLNADY